MAGEIQSEMQCAEFEALLSDAHDGKLSPPKLNSFHNHRKQCQLCGPMFAEAESGLRWLKSLEEVEPPAMLMHNILAATIGIQSAEQVVHARPQSSPLDRLRAWLAPLWTPVWGAVRQPRFAMSFGMVFFSLSVGLNVAGVKLTDVRRVDLRPSALTRTYYSTSARVVRYYQNIRFVYELESRVRDLKRATTPEEQAQPAKEKNRKNDTSGAPDHKQDQNYSRDESQPLLASIPVGTPPQPSNVRRIA